MFTAIKQNYWFDSSTPHHRYIAIGALGFGQKDGITVYL
jgi:hypothetical protein